MLEIYTSRLSNYRGPLALDITRGGVEEAQRKGQSIPGGFLAPSRQLLNWGLGAMRSASQKAKRQIFADYAEKYRNELRGQYMRDAEQYHGLLDRQRVVLCCYCEEPACCHRTVAAQILVTLGKGRAVYGGELWEGGGLGALSVWPEWAWAMPNFGKNIENRTWGRQSVVGRWLAIHGSKSIGGQAHLKDDRFNDYHADSVQTMINTAAHAGVELPPGPLVSFARILDEGRGIIAVARIADCVQQHDSGWFFGPFGFVLENMTKLERPVAVNGAQGFWKVPSAALEQVRDRLPAECPAGLREYLNFSAEGSL